MPKHGFPKVSRRPDRLDAYRSKREAGRTPEPVSAARPVRGADDTFVVQEHHARRLHWDFRLEHDGVLVSWALPKGLPEDPRTNRLAVHVEDHPLDYASFSGVIPKGEYGGGTVSVWDHGTYETEKWTDDEVKVVLHGERATGRYVLFRTGGDSWMAHRMDPPDPPSSAPMPTLIRPMLATPGTVAPGARSHAYEMKWDGLRAVAYLHGEGLRLLSRSDSDITVSYPELRPLAQALAGHSAVLDGEIVAFDRQGRPDFGLLQQRMHVTDPNDVRRGERTVPVTYVIFDLLHLDGTDTTPLAYHERRRLLENLNLLGPAWQTPPYFAEDASVVIEASRRLSMEGVVAKRLDSRYQPGKRSRDWVKIKNVYTQEVVIGGWREGHGNRADTLGSLLIGVPGPNGLDYAGHVGTGFRAIDLTELHRRLVPLLRNRNPFSTVLPRADSVDAHWIEPVLVGEVAYSEVTRDGRLRHPVWRGLRPDKDVADVTWET